MGVCTGSFLLEGVFPPLGVFPELDFPLEGVFPITGDFPILDAVPAGVFPLPGAFSLLALAWTCDPFLDFGVFPEVGRGVSPSLPPEFYPASRNADPFPYSIAT